VSHFEFSWQSNDSLNIYGQGWAPEKQPKCVICLVHGLGDHSSRFSHVGEFLNNQEFALLAYDQRGHGKSQGQRGHTPSYQAMLLDLSCFLKEAEKRYPSCPHFLYGHSMGGNLVLNYVLRVKPPLAGAIATAPWLRTGFKPPAWKVAVGKMLRSVRPTHALSNELDMESLSHDPVVVKQAKEDPLYHDQITVRLYFDFIKAGEWALAHAADFPCPLLLMQGTGDKLTSPEATQKFADSADEHCTLKLWEGLYHEIHNELEKQEVLGFLCEWIKKAI
jgi:alpha-beta hydrolase superfamily lysophospholipase